MEDETDATQDTRSFDRWFKIVSEAKKWQRDEWIERMNTQLKESACPAFEARLVRKLAGGTSRRASDATRGRRWR
jgi:hypothetical protein